MNKPVFERVFIDFSELDSLRKDAERYRALRDSGMYSARSGGGWGLSMSGEWSKSALDAAADKLIAQGNL